MSRSSDFKSALLRFWQPDLPERPIALLRIGIGLIVLMNAAIWFHGLLEIFSDRGAVSLATVRETASYARISLFYLLPDTAFSVFALYLLYVVSGVAITAGVFSRVFVLVVWLIQNSFLDRFGYAGNGGHALLSFLLLAMALLPLENRWAVAGLLPEFEKTVVRSYQRAAFRAIQVEICILYLSTFINKVILSGSSWVDGTSVYFVTRGWDLLKMKLPFVFDNIWSIRALSFGTLIIELALGLILFLPKYRRPILAAGVLLHMGMELSLLVPIFQFVLLAAYAVFLGDSDFQRKSVVAN